MEDRNSLFTLAERKSNAVKEHDLIAEAKQVGAGAAFNKLLGFWAVKRQLFKNRTIERFIS